MDRYFLKEKLKIKTIGKDYFWVGIIIGLNFNLILLLLISYLREGMFLSTLSFQRDLIRLDNKEYLWIDLIIALLNTVITFGITQIIWTVGIIKNNKTRKLKHKYYSIITFVAFVTITLFAVFYRVVTITTFYTISLGTHKLLLEYYDLRYFLIVPVIIFFTLWSKYQIYFRTYKWIIISFLALTTIGIILGLNFPVNRNIIKNIYESKFEHEYRFIDKNLLKIYEKDSKEFMENRKKLRSKTSKEIQNLIIETKNKFAKLDSISIDTLIFQKILIHNFNGEYIYLYPKKNNDCWLYANPNDIKRLINTAELHSIEMNLLFEILYEQLNYVLLYDDYFNVDMESFKLRKRTAIYFLFEYYCPEILLELQTVRNALYKNPRYLDYHDYLPDIEPKINKILND